MQLTRDESTESALAMVMPGAPAPRASVKLDGIQVVSWGRFALWAPLFVTVFAVNCLLSLPPIVRYKEALRQTTEAFFGYETALPWE